jgi:protein tyrosine phosphatase (PTP) superfamily phosphohydrolase (DUF442 family)
VTLARAASLAALLAALLGCARPRPALGNLGRVDDGLWRSAQPTAAGFAEARRLGVATVVDLRCSHDDAEATRDAGLSVVRVPMRQWHVDEERVAAALRAMSDPALRPVLVHCQEGRDRTGLVVAAYRVALQGWSREAAVAEMRAHGNHPTWANLRRWVLSFDVERLRARIGDPRPPGR